MLAPNEEPALGKTETKSSTAAECLKLLVADQ